MQYKLELVIKKVYFLHYSIQLRFYNIQQYWKLTP